MTSGPRVVLVTGASSGIGRAVVLEAAAAGDHLVLAARDQASLDGVAKECESAGAASALVVPTDVGDDSSVARCFAKATDRHGRVDAVVSCAAVIAYGRTEEIPVEVFDGVLRTNLTGSVNVARHALVHMRQQHRGTLVLVGSVAGHVASPQMTPYVVSKWGIRALARQLRIENRDLGDVSIAYVAPGGVDTPIYEQAANYAGFAGRPPPPVATPEKVARVILGRLGGRGRTHTTWTNHPIRLGFMVVPKVFDALAGPFFRLVVSDRARTVATTTGNVFEANAERERLRGDAGSAMAAVARNVVATIRDR